MQWTSLNAEQKINLWRTINLEELFEGHSTVIDLPTFASAIRQWLNVVNFLTCAHNECECTITNNSFQDAVKKYWRTFKIVKDRTATPYIHAIISHAPAMLSKFNSLRIFSTSAQELKNSLQTIVQFRATNQQNVPKDVTVHQLTLLWFQSQTDVTVPFKLKRCKNSSIPDI